jgi:hypothetical protein
MFFDETQHQFKISGRLVLGVEIPIFLENYPQETAGRI